MDGWDEPRNIHFSIWSYFVFPYVLRLIIVGTDPVSQGVGCVLGCLFPP